MNQKYKFFISSSIELYPESKIIENIVLELEQYPLNIDQNFNINKSSFEIMKQNIDESNCFILLIEENYKPKSPGSINELEVEYNYALEKNIPIFCFIKKTDGDNSSSEFMNFKKRLLNNRAVLWQDVNELKLLVRISLLKWLNYQYYETFNKNRHKNKNNAKYDETISYQQNLKNTLGLYTTNENNDIIGLMVTNLSEIKQFYKLTKDQADNAYKLAKNSCIAGILLILIAVLTALVFNNNQIAITTTLGGIIVEVLAGTSLFVYQKTLKQLNYYYASLHNNERFLSLINIVGKTSIKDELYSKIVESELDNLKQYEIKNDKTQ